MPLPVAHALVGAGTIAIFHPEVGLKRDWKALLFGAVLAVLPDLDFLLVWVFHLGGGWHRGFTHSIAIAFLAACVFLLALGLSRLRTALAFGTAVLSHGLLDFATTNRG